jgi:valyl-tRNA synthetase
VWHSYCDWYIEFLKPIFDSKNMKNIEETRVVSAFVQANILILLHPFIPFFTEKVWQDFKFANYFNKPLMFKDWKIKSHLSFSKNHSKIDWLIDLVTNIRSTKVNLNISPGSFIDVSTAKLSSNKIGIINDNLEVFKRLGRVSNVSRTKLNNNGVKIIVGGETIILYFDQNFDLLEQKQKILNKVKNLDLQIKIISEKMKNKSFLKNAPKQIVDKEKKTLIDYKFELKKLNSILNSIKN